MSGDHNKHAFDGMTIDASEPIKTDWPESAFPSTFKSLHPHEHQQHRWGMTLLDYFAAHATEEDICVALDSVKKVEVVRVLGDGTKAISRGYPSNARQIARYIHANAMLKARDKMD